MEKLSDSQMYDILKQIWTPGYKFPFRTSYGKARKFIFSWFQKFPWLAYSGMFDGALCIPCVFFGRRAGSNSYKLERLMMCPLVDWSIATRRFNDHECKSEIHQTSLLTMQTFISVMENEIKPISQIQSEALEKQVSKNREKFSSIVKTILLCGRQNIPLKGGGVKKR